VASGSPWYSPSPSTLNVHCRQAPKSLLTAALRKSSSGRLSFHESERLKPRRTRTGSVYDHCNSSSNKLQPCPFWIPRNPPEIELKLAETASRRKLRLVSR
jgi:hypothetical protein